MNPKPDVIYFMTDGNSNKNFQGMEIIKQRRVALKFTPSDTGLPGPRNPLS